MTSFFKRVLKGAGTFDGAFLGSYGTALMALPIGLMLLGYFQPKSVWMQLATLGVPYVSLSLFVLWSFGGEEK